MSEPLDPRLNAFRSDMADSRLKGIVSAKEFREGQSFFVSASYADLFKEPDRASGLQMQLLHGQSVRVFDNDNKWSWVQSDYDNYVGYVRSDSLESSDTQRNAKHIVIAPRTFLYPKPDLKTPHCGAHSMGSMLHVVEKITTRGTDYAIIDSGEAVIADHLCHIDQRPDDVVSIAESLLHTPYLWGGNTGFGVDCSGLVSLANIVCGNDVLRDSDMQTSTLGHVIEPDFSNLERGDLIFWKGHVGMMADSEMLLHANGNTMNVALENIHDAINRIGYLYGQPTGVRRS